MRSFILSLNKPRYTLLLTILLVSFFTIRVLKRVHFDVSSFVTAGDQFCQPSQVPANLTVLPNDAGYDGQFYYRLSLNPFTTKKVEHGITLDTPAYRQQRILYPLLVWALSFGQARFVPVLLVLLNAAGLCVLGWAGGTFAVWRGRHALWGILLPLYPGFQLTLVRDLVEITEITLATASILLLIKHRHYLATALLALAVLSKETALIVAVACAGIYLWEKLRPPKTPTVKWFYFVIPLSIYAVWQAALFLCWGEFSVQGGRGTLGLPGIALTGFVSDVWQVQTMLHRKNRVELTFLFLFTLYVIYALRSFTANLLPVALSWFLYIGLALTLTNKVWVEDWAFFRALSEFYVFGAMLVIASGRITRVITLVTVILAWLYVFSCFIYWPPLF